MSKPIRRREHLAPRGEQVPLFVTTVVDDGSARRGAPLFKNDDPTKLYVGPKRLDDYLRDSGMAWVLRLREVICGFNYESFTRDYVGTGRRPFHPRALIGLILYGILSGRSSLRELEELARLDLGAWWMTGGGQPDHSVLGRFIKKHAALLTDEFFVEATRDCAQRLNIKPSTAAADGTVLEAAASRFRALVASKLVAKAEEAEAAANADPANETLQSNAKKLAYARDVAVERTAKRQKHGRKGEVPVVPDEPDAVVQGLKDGDRVRPAYKPVVMAHECGLLIGQTVEASSENKAVQTLFKQHQEILGAYPKSALFDAGFFAGDVLAFCVDIDVDVLCPPGKALDNASFERASNGKFAKSAFEYVEGEKTLRCPARTLMTISSAGEDAFGEFQEFKGVGCSDCHLKAACTSSKTGRSVKRYEHDALKEGMRDVFKNPRARRAYAQRPRIAETPFAKLKLLGLDRLRRRGLRGARVEFALFALALNVGMAAGRGLLMFGRVRIRAGDDVVAEAWFLKLTNA